jgi:hypothetical protein
LTNEAGLTCLAIFGPGDLWEDGSATDAFELQRRIYTRYPLHASKKLHLKELKAAREALPKQKS